MSQQQSDNTRCQKQYGFGFGASTKGELSMEVIKVLNTWKLFWVALLAISSGDAVFWYVIDCPIQGFFQQANGLREYCEIWTYLSIRRKEMIKFSAAKACAEFMMRYRNAYPDSKAKRSRFPSPFSCEIVSLDGELCFLLLCQRPANTPYRDHSRITLMLRET